MEITEKIKEIKRVNQDDQCDFSCLAESFKASSVAIFHLFSLIFKFDLQGNAESISPVQKDRKVKNKTSYRFSSFKEQRSANMASVVAMVTTVQKGWTFLPWPTHSWCSAFILIAPPHTTCSSCICSCFPPFVQSFVLLCDYPNPFSPVNYVFTVTRCSRTLVWMQILKCCYAIKSHLSHTDWGKNIKSATVSTLLLFFTIVPGSWRSVEQRAATSTFAISSGANIRSNDAAFKNERTENIQRTTRIFEMCLQVSKRETNPN